MAVNKRTTSYWMARADELLAKVRAPKAGVMLYPESKAQNRAVEELIKDGKLVELSEPEYDVEFNFWSHEVTTPAWLAA